MVLVRWSCVLCLTSSNFFSYGYGLRVHTCNCKTVNVYVWYVYLGTVQLYPLLPVHTKIPGTVPSSF